LIPASEPSGYPNNSSACWFTETMTPSSSTTTDASGMSETTALSSSLEIALSSAAEDALSVWMCGPLPLSLIALVPFNPESPAIATPDETRESWLSVHEVVTQCVRVKKSSKNA